MIRNGRSKCQCQFQCLILWISRASSMSSHFIDVEHKVHTMLSQCHSWFNYCTPSMTKLFDWIISLSHSILCLSLSLSAALPLLCLSLSIYLYLLPLFLPMCFSLCLSISISHAHYFSLYVSLSPSLIISLSPSLFISIYMYLCPSISNSYSTDLSI